MSSDPRGDAAWTDPERPPGWGEGLTDHGGGVWSTWLRDADGQLDARPHIWHWCDHSVWIARAKAEGREPVEAEPRWGLAGTGAHDMPSRDPLTLSPSLHLPDCCGLHGFLTDGVWRSV